jgi:hypothetical protein
MKAVASVAAARDALAGQLGSTSRGRCRRMRQAEADAHVAVHRLELMRLLTSIGAFQLGLAELSCRQASAARPELAAANREVVDCLATAVRAEIEGFMARGAGGRR